MLNLEKIKQSVLSWLFPVFCVNCGSEGEWWCEKCREKNKVKIINFCNQCGANLEFYADCQTCSAKPKFGVTALFDYHANPEVAKLIKLYKYNYARNIYKVWEQVFSQVSVTSWNDAVVIPVPLYQRRLRRRGFNLAEDVAQILAKQLGLLVNTEDLKRIRATKQQVKLNRTQRAENVADAFAWVNKKPAPRRVILVDDVFTTGATLRASAAALLAAGSEEVWAVVLARD